MEMANLIQTMYLGPTNTKVARIVATMAGIRRVYPYDHAGQAHQKACEAFAKEFGLSMEGALVASMKAGWAYMLPMASK